jgi:hypothetical protein
MLIGLAALAAAGGCARMERLAGLDPRPPVEGGIGGTGIVGVVTELGSIVVAGRRVALPASAALSDAFGPRAPGDLRPGHSLTVEAAPGPDGGLAAARVRIEHPVIGTVGGMADAGGRLRIAGVEVIPEPGVPVRAAPGLRVAVSGLWRGGAVVASRIDVLAAQGPDVLAGDAGRDAAGRPTLGPLPLDPGDAAAPEPGSYAIAIGAATGGGFRALRLLPGRFTGAAGPLADLLVEGYLARAPAPPDWRIAGLGHSFDAGARVDPLAGTRALFAGPYTGAFAVEAALPLPEGLAARRRALPPGTEVAAVPGAVPTR